MAKTALVGIKRGAEKLNVKPSWFYGRIHGRNLPFRYFKVGAYIRFREEDLDAYLESVCIDQTQGTGNVESCQH